MERQSRRVVWIEQYLRLNPGYLRIHQMQTLNVPENQNNRILYVTSWSTDISSFFFFFDINLFLIDYAFCELCNIWLLLFENNSRSYHYRGTSHWRKNIVAVITQDRVIEYNLQIKNPILCTCRLFLLTRIFRYISNRSKECEHLPTFFLQYLQSNNFFQIFQINNFSVDYAVLYINWANTSLLIIPGTLATLKLPVKSHPS